MNTHTFGKILAVYVGAILAYYSIAQPYLLESNSKALLILNFCFGTLLIGGLCGTVILIMVLMVRDILKR
jgi:hypothetical protein